MKDKLRRESLKAEPNYEIIAKVKGKVDESLKFATGEQVGFRIALTKCERIKLKLNPPVFSLCNMEASKTGKNILSFKQKTFIGHLLLTK